MSVSTKCVAVRSARSVASVCAAANVASTAVTPSHLPSRNDRRETGLARTAAAVPRRSSSWTVAPAVKATMKSPGTSSSARPLSRASLPSSPKV